MSRYFSLLVAVLLAASVTACTAEDESAAGEVATTPDNAITVIATTSQIGALVREVAGDAVNLHVLIDAGVDPHDYEATPANLRAIGDADLILKNGIGLDDFLDDTIESANGEAEIVTVTDGIELVEGGQAHDDAHNEHEDEHEDDDHEAHDSDDDHDDDHGHGEYDPHVWHDPANAKIMVDNITAALSNADPGNASSFEENADTYKTLLDETDADIRAMFDDIPVEDRKLVTTHDAFGYFIHAYDFEFIGAVIPGTSTDAEPSARDIAALTELIEHEDVKAIFAEDTVDPRIAEQLANDTGVQIVYGLHSDSLGEPGSGEDTIHGMLLANATKISEALQ